MNTLIEILDYEQTENMISPLVFDFDHIIYLYDQYHDFRRKRKTLYNLLRKKGITDIDFILVSDDAESVFDTLSKQYPDAVYNCSNGSRTLLIKMARYCEKHHLKSFALNFQRKTFHDLNGCKDMEIGFKVPHISIEDVISLSSGEIITTGHALPQMSETMETDIMNIIDIMNMNSSAWTRLLGTIAKELREQEPSMSELWIPCPKDKAQLKLLNALDHQQILRLEEHQSELLLIFKNRTLMKMFADSGAWLEYQAYLECYHSKWFDDVRISTIVDWNIESDNKNDPTCEIDLIVIRNCIPAFVSCKMNKCTALDLYEIKLLSSKLGGSLGKAAVITKAAALNPNEPLYLKAQELEILIIGAEDIEQGRIAQRLLEFLKS